MTGIVRERGWLPSLEWVILATCHCSLLLRVAFSSKFTCATNTFMFLVCFISICVFPSQLPLSPIFYSPVFSPCIFQGSHHSATGPQLTGNSCRAHVNVSSSEHSGPFDALPVMKISIHRCLSELSQTGVVCCSYPLLGATAEIHYGVHQRCPVPTLSATDTSVLWVSWIIEPRKQKSPLTAAATC
jgi:hypothetical protein